MSGDLGSYRRAQEARRALLNRGSRNWGPDAVDGKGDAAVAQHEGAHTIVARLLGLDVTAVTIEPGAHFDGFTTWVSKPDRAFDLIVVAMAGSEGERLFGSADNGHKNDLREARALAESISDDVEGTIKRARRCARKILMANFVPLTKLAVALIDKRTLFAGEIEEIIVANSVDDDAYRGDGADDDDGELESALALAESVLATVYAEQRLASMSASHRDDDGDDGMVTLAEYMEARTGGRLRYYGE